MSEELKQANVKAERAARMIRDVLNAEGDAIGCEECYEVLDRYAELVEAGKDVTKVYPEVKKHLEDCFCCGEEFQALQAALEAARDSVEAPG